MQHYSLKEVREKLLRYRRESVSRMSGIALERLDDIEDAGSIPTVFEVDALSRLYGVDADRLAEDPIRLVPGDSVATLASLREFTDLDDLTRARIVAAANAARDLVQLRKLQSPADDPREQLKRESTLLTPAKKNEPPYRQGSSCATQLRQRLGLKDEPIASLRDLVAERFPSISVIYANLTSDGPAGLSFVDPLRGPAIVLNLEGKNKNPCVRRFSMAHELGHILVDWNRHQPLAVISGYLHESHLEIEQRANAFAVRFLCPESVIRGLKPDALEDPKVLRALAKYGLPYRALCLYLRNEAGHDLPDVSSPAALALSTESRWVAAEEPTGISGFPISGVPPERKTDVARFAARLYSEGRLARDRFADLLGVTPAAELESVLDFFDLPLPDDHAASVAAG